MTMCALGSALLGKSGPSPARKRKRAPCRACGKIVARVLYGGRVGNGLRGEFAHKCPHGTTCRAGTKLHRNSHIQSAPNCSECNERMRVANLENIARRGGK